MTVGRWSFEKDLENKAFIIYRNQKIFAIASYNDLTGDDTEDEVWKGVREMADCIEMGRPYLEALGPNTFD
jgi:hypothetical protein